MRADLRFSSNLLGIGEPNAESAALHLFRRSVLEHGYYEAQLTS